MLAACERWNCRKLSVIRPYKQEANRRRLGMVRIIDAKKSVAAICRSQSASRDEHGTNRLFTVCQQRVLLYQQRQMHEE